MFFVLSPFLKVTTTKTFMKTFWKLFYDYINIWLYVFVFVCFLNTYSSEICLFHLSLASSIQNIHWANLLPTDIDVDYSFCHSNKSVLKTLLIHCCVCAHVHLYHKLLEVNLVDLNICAYFISTHIAKVELTHMYTIGVYCRHTYSEIQDVLYKICTVFKIILKYREGWK